MYCLKEVIMKDGSIKPLLFFDNYKEMKEHCEKVYGSYEELIYTKI